MGKPPSSSRITLQQIADVCGVSRNTVSCALRGQGRISEATRKRILETAERMGYQQDARISELTSYLATRKRSQDIQEELAYVWVPLREGDLRQQYPHYLEALKRVGTQHGFHIEPYCLGPGGWTPDKLESILEARGVRGVFLTPIHRHPYPYPLHWERYCCLAFGHYYREPALQSLGFSFYQAVFTCYRNLHRLGYRRIGVISPFSFDKHLDFAVRAADAVVQSITPEEHRVLILENDYLGDPALLPDLTRAWVEAQQPEAIIAPDVWYTHLQALDIRMPDDVAFASLRKEPVNPNARISGVTFNLHTFTQRAMELMVSMLRHERRGIPEEPVCTRLTGDWEEGETTPQVGEPVVLPGFDNHGP